MCVYYLSWLGDFLANLPCRFARTLLEMLQSTLAGMCEKFTEDNPDLTTQEVLAQLNAKYMNEVRWVAWSGLKKRSLVESMPRQPSLPWTFIILNLKDNVDMSRFQWHVHFKCHVSCPCMYYRVGILPALHLVTSKGWLETWRTPHLAREEL